MTITREQVADLQPGDVVQVAHPKRADTFTQGPITTDNHGCLLVGNNILRSSEEWASVVRPELITVVSHAPRPLYVNHPRTEPVASDVMHRDGDDPWRMFGYSGDRWVLVGGTHEYETDDLRGAPFRLLVDGETGQVVP